MVFDPETVGSGDATLVADLPGDSARLTAGSQGIERVLVGGTAIVEHGVAPGATPGVLLRSGRDTETVTARCGVPIRSRSTSRARRRRPCCAPVRGRLLDVRRVGARVRRTRGVCCVARPCRWRDGPPHFGLLLDNVPDFTMLGGGGVGGVRTTECQLVVTDATNRPLLDDLDLGAANGRVLVIDTPEYAEMLAPHRDAPLPANAVDPSTQIFLLFTSGTTGAPKAAICTQGRLERISAGISATAKLERDDVCYLSMPLFHSNALFTARWNGTARPWVAVAALQPCGLGFTARRERWVVGPPR